MLVINVGEEEVFDEETQTFSTEGGFELKLEHSLVSLSKWESKWQIPFLGDQDKTPEMMVDYLYCMILTEDYPEGILDELSAANVETIQNYIGSSQTATTFGPEQKKGGPRAEIITSELVYYWMASFQIPMECQYWHLNRLFTLIRIANVKNSNNKSMPKQEIARRNRDLNEERKKRLGTKG